MWTVLSCSRKLDAECGFNRSRDYRVSLPNEVDTAIAIVNKIVVVLTGGEALVVQYHVRSILECRKIQCIWSVIDGNRCSVRL